MTNKRERIQDAVYTKRYVYNTYYHIIWCTKYRHQLFDDLKLKNELKNILYKISTDNDIEIKNMEIMPDHIHLLVSFPPSKSASTILKALKGRSGFLLLKNHPNLKTEKFWGGHIWSSSYYIGTVGNMSKNTVNKYINDQMASKPR